jgi:cytochrome c553
MAIRTHAALFALLALSGAGFAQEGTPAFAPPNLSAKGVQALAMNCAICHGTAGRPAAGSSVAALAGRPAAQIAEAMDAFRQGTRSATVMHQIAKGYSDAEIDAMARWFAVQKRSP